HPGKDHARAARWTRQGAGRVAGALYLDDLSQRLYGNARGFGGKYARGGKNVDERFGRDDSPGQRRRKKSQGSCGRGSYGRGDRWDIRRGQGSRDRSGN